ncbi:MAG: hypothetical protein P9F19_06875 [Candidatus Contendobacter sp.]|nr:hypothetical protein [Candidatus Contendobacter sp.]MDG4557094.1 hypothetical protein [Candidatus Contendobacter sp.]
MFERLVVLVLASWLASACASPEEQRAADAQHCSGFGFTMGTRAFANCMISMANQSDAQQAAVLSQQTARDAERAQARQARDRATQDARDRRTGFATPLATPNEPTRSDHSKFECQREENTVTLPDGTIRMTSNERCSPVSF